MQEMEPPCAIYNTRRSMRGDGSGYLCLAGPYSSNEQWMMERVIADMERGGIAYEVRVGEYRGEMKQSFVWRSAVGYRHTREADHAQYTAGDEPDKRFVRRRAAA